MCYNNSGSTGRLSRGSKEVFAHLNEKLKEKIKESLSSVLPITAIVLELICLSVANRITYFL